MLIRYIPGLADFLAAVRDGWMLATAIDLRLPARRAAVANE